MVRTEEWEREEGGEIYVSSWCPSSKHCLKQGKEGLALLCFLLGYNFGFSTAFRLVLYRRGARERVPGNVATHTLFFRLERVVLRAGNIVYDTLIHGFTCRPTEGVL